MMSSLKWGVRGKGRHHGLAHGVRELVVGYAQHVHLDAGGEKRDDRVHVHGDARRRVEGDGRPDECRYRPTRCGEPSGNRAPRWHCRPRSARLGCCSGAVNPMSWNIAPA